MGTKCLVTGGGGFIGSNLVRRLLADGHTVRVLDNFATGRRANLAGLDGAFELIEGDIRDPAAAAAAVRGVAVVFHQAAVPSVPRSVADPVLTNDVNIGGTLAMLVAARDAGVGRFVVASSSSVYGNTPTLPKVETMKPTPRSPYALQKLAAETYACMFHPLYGLATFALRYFNVFGPRQDPQSQYAAVVPAFITAALAGQAPVVHGDGRQTRDFTFVEDVVSANLACMTAPETAAGAAYNIAYGSRTSVGELARMIIRGVGATVEPVFVETRAGDVRDSQGDAALARAQLGWTPAHTLESGLARTIAFYREG